MFMFRSQYTLPLPLLPERSLAGDHPVKPLAAQGESR